MAYAAATDLEQRWRPLDSAEKTRAEALLEDAAVRIDSCVPPPPEPEHLSDAELAVRLVVSCDMVRRAMVANEQAVGVTQESVTAGAFSHQRTFANPAGDLYLSKADKTLLGHGRQRAGNISILGTA